MSEHRFLLRLPEVLWLELQRSAQGARRSVNSEIVWRLSGGVPVVVKGRLWEGGSNPLLTPDSVAGLPGAGRPRGVTPDVRGFKPDFGKRLKP